MKRILTIQDISCVGKCSLTVALPVISACGVEAAVLPTAVLSNHTAFSSFTFRDLTDDIDKISNEWQKQKIDFDAIYSGYLGSFEQVNLVSDIFEKFKTHDNFILVDPVMGDHGKLYTGFDNKFAKAMTKLCKHADIIVPNLTEAAFMLDIPYVEKGYSEQYIKDVLKKLTDLGCKKAVLTGISFNSSDLGVYGYDKQTDEYFSYFKQQLPLSFHGTGDIFASTLCGALSRGKSFNQALKIAVDFTVESISVSIKNPNRKWYGVDFESALPYLIKKINE